MLVPMDELLPIGDMPSGRDLDWQGCVNVRDLGGLPTIDGRVTGWGAVVRADNPAHLSARGWAALADHGVRTIVALRTIGATDDEPDTAMVPAGVRIVRVHVDDATDPTFVERCVENQWWETPLEFGEMLERWPDRCAAAVDAVASAPRGGVVVSCGRGADRTGLVAFLLLALADVEPTHIAADWSRSLDRLASTYPEHRSEVAAVLARADTTVDEVVSETIERVHIAERLEAGGLRAAAIDTVCRRLLG